MAEDDDRKAVAADNESSAATQSALIRLMRSSSMYVSVCALTGLACMIVQNEIAWSANTTAGFGRFCPDARDLSCDPRDAAMMFPIRKERLTLNVIRAVGVTLPTLLALFFTTRYYAACIAFMRSKNQLPASATLLTTPRLRAWYLVEMIVLSVHVFPGIDEYTDSPALYLTFSQFMFIRLLFLVRVVRYRSSLNSSNGRFIGALTNVDFDAGFILKTALKENPIRFMASLLALLIFSSAYAVRMIESVMCAWDRALGCDPLDFWDALWLIVITTLTIGYGDIVARTPGGRFVSVVGGMGGTVITAVTIAIMTDYLQLSRSEAKVVTFLRKHNYRQLVRNSAALVIQTAYRLHRFRQGGFAVDRDTVITRRLAKEAAEARKATLRDRAIIAAASQAGKPGTARGPSRTPVHSRGPNTARAMLADVSRGSSTDASKQAQWSLFGMLFGSPQRTVPVSSDAMATSGDPQALMSPTEQTAMVPSSLNGPSPSHAGAARKLFGADVTGIDGDAAAGVSRRGLRPVPKPLVIPGTAPGGGRSPAHRGTPASSPTSSTSMVTSPDARRKPSDHDDTRVAAQAAASGPARSRQSYWRMFSCDRSRCACRPSGGATRGTATATVRLYERLLFERVEYFRRTKRWVLSHDPTDPMDKQLTILETLEVNVDDIKSNIETLSEFLLGPAVGANADGNASSANIFSLLASAAPQTARDAVNQATAAATLAVTNGALKMASSASRAALAVATGGPPPLMRLASHSKLLQNAAAEGVNGAAPVGADARASARSGGLDSPSRRMPPPPRTPAGGAVGSPIVPPLGSATPAGRSAFTRVVVSTPAHGATLGATAESTEGPTDAALQPARRRFSGAGIAGFAIEETRALQQQVQTLTAQLQQMTDVLLSMKSGYADYVKATDARIASLEMALARSKRHRGSAATGSAPEGVSDADVLSARSGASVEASAVRSSAGATANSAARSPTAKLTNGTGATLAQASAGHTGSTSMLPPITSRRGSSTAPALPASRLAVGPGSAGPTPSDSPVRDDDIGKGLASLLDADVTGSKAGATAASAAAAKRGPVRAPSKRRLDAPLASLPEDSAVVRAPAPTEPVQPSTAESETPATGWSLWRA